MADFAAVVAAAAAAPAAHLPSSLTNHSPSHCSVLAARSTSSTVPVGLRYASVAAAANPAVSNRSTAASVSSAVGTVVAVADAYASSLVGCVCHRWSMVMDDLHPKHVYETVQGMCAPWKRGMKKR